MSDFLARPLCIEGCSKFLLACPTRRDVPDEVEHLGSSHTVQQNTIESLARPTTADSTFGPPELFFGCGKPKLFRRR